MQLYYEMGGQKSDSLFYHFLVFFESVLSHSSHFFPSSGSQIWLIGPNRWGREREERKLVSFV
jgi:hypothetical protein